MSTAKLEPAGCLFKEKQHFPQSHHYGEDFGGKKRKGLDRSNKELQPKPQTPEWEQVSLPCAELPSPWPRSKPSRQGTGSTGERELEFGVLALEKLTVQSES